MADTKTDWNKPQDVDGLTAALPTDVSHLMPRMADIPEEFTRFNGTGWNRWASGWFFNGLPSFPEAKPGIDREKAKRHLAAIQGSWEPKHEHKEAAVAYLASLWLKSS